jgi:hypothetical protein
VSTIRIEDVAATARELGLGDLIQDGRPHDWRFCIVLDSGADVTMH